MLEGGARGGLMKAVKGKLMQFWNFSNKFLKNPFGAAFLGTLVTFVEDMLEVIEKCKGSSGLSQALVLMSIFYTFVLAATLIVATVATPVVAFILPILIGKMVSAVKEQIIARSCPSA